ncbi:MAG TPA: response regulator transcription factor [Phototrophicaceae bacterium]|nr:response regulator transcription factor [Phototrophicaceae bacterium]
MEAARILFIGRIQTNQATASALEKRYHVLAASSGKQALTLASAQLPHLIVLDAVSMRTPGERICQELRTGLPGIPIIHIHPGPKETAQSRADVLLFSPLSTRKLTGAVSRLLKTQDNELINCGPFVMNLGQRVLIVAGQETQLTPKQALLVETFFRHAGQTVERKMLMEKVWNTDYLGDTRTLDVHIRWLRKVLESDPSKPRYLLTVRGVGYRLEIPEQELLEEEPELVLPLPVGA